MEGAPAPSPNPPVPGPVLNDPRDAAPTGLEQLVADLLAECAEAPLSAGSAGRLHVQIVGFEDLCSRYRNHLVTEAEALRGSLEREDWRELRDRVHRLAGTAGCYGFTQIAHIARQVEKAMCHREWTQDQIWQVRRASAAGGRAAAAPSPSVPPAGRPEIP